MSEKFQNLLEHPLTKSEFHELESKDGIATVHVLVSQSEMSTNGGDDYYDLLTSKVSTENVFAIVKSEIVAIFDNKKNLIVKLSLDISGKILPATYVTSWDGGYLYKSNCFLDTQKHVVFNISLAPGNHEHLENLEAEYIILPDGLEIPVINEDDFEGSKEELQDALANKKFVIACD